MDLQDKILNFDQSIPQFFADCDFIVGNFEATITDLKRSGMDQKHTPQIMDSLEKLFPPKKTYLSVANNHAGDYGWEEFRHSCDRLIERGFHVFGLKDAPNINPVPEINLMTGTMWSNRTADYIVQMDQIETLISPDLFNIGFLHWGYEMELYPRPKIVENASKLFEKIDLIVGHHSHCPQPITLDQQNNKNNLQKLIAYSLGDFCFGKHFQNYHYGLLLKCDVGYPPDNQDKGKKSMKLGNYSWSFIHCAPAKTSTVEVSLIDTVPFFPAISNYIR
jgi:hypothetical protein